MNFIEIIIKKLRPKDISRPLGRWRIENCNTKMNKKIDLSNEDHCGPCGEYGQFRRLLFAPENALEKVKIGQFRSEKKAFSRETSSVRMR